jgi:hypothetical protein
MSLINSDDLKKKPTYSTSYWFWFDTKANSIC